MNVMFFAGSGKSILQFNSQLVKSIGERGHHVICIGSEPNLDEAFSGLGAQYVRIPFDRQSVSPLTAISVIRTLRKLICRYHIDLYYGFQAIPATYGAIAAQAERVPHVFVAITGAGKIVQRRAGFFNRCVRAGLNVLLKCSLKKCGGVFFLNDDNLEYFVRNKLVSADRCIKVNGSGVSVERYRFCEISHSDRFLYVGALLRLKGIMEYMEAARLVKAKYPNAVFPVVGGMDQRVSVISQEELDRYTEDGRVSYVGFQRDVRPFLEDAGVFVLPSYSEGIPTSVLEAMAVGRPVITTNAPGCRETVEDGVNGLLVPPGDAQRLATAMEWCILHPEECRTMGRKARQICEERFDVNKVNAAMMAAMGL